MLRHIFAAIAPLALLACGGDTGNNGSAAGNNVANAAARPSSDAQNRVRGLDEGQRHGLLIRAIRDAGQQCQHVERSQSVQTTNNMLTYLVSCSGGYEYAVVIRDDGVAIVQPAMREEGQ